MRRLAISFLSSVLAFALVDAQPATGPLDAKAVKAPLDQFHVPGVSIAVVKDFKIDWARGYGMAIMTNGDNGFSLIQELRGRIEPAYGWDVFDKPVPRAYGPRANSQTRDHVRTTPSPNC